MADINENTVDNVNEAADNIAEASAENISGAVTENAGGDSPEPIKDVAIEEPRKAGKIKKEKPIIIRIITIKFIPHFFTFFKKINNIFHIFKYNIFFII